jgi:hypothetical protein
MELSIAIPILEFAAELSSSRTSLLWKLLFQFTIRKSWRVVELNETKLNKAHESFSVKMLIDKKNRNGEES